MLADSSSCVLSAHASGVLTCHHVPDPLGNLQGCSGLLLATPVYVLMFLCVLLCVRELMCLQAATLVVLLTRRSPLP